MKNFQTVANRYSIGEEIANRPNCKVYRATDTDSSAEVVVKFFSDTPADSAALREQFEAEVAALVAATTAQATTQSYLAQVLAGGVEDGVFYLVMESLSGSTLRQLLKQQDSKPLKLSEAFSIAEQLALGLQTLHNAGIYHGHLDSRAILVEQAGVKLAGYCPQAIDEARMAQTSMGAHLIDPAYIAPEQISGEAEGQKVDYRVDTYSLAVIIFEMLTGQKPFSASNPVQTAMLRLSEEAPSAAERNPELSALMDAAIRKGLSRNPADRFSKVIDLVETVSSKFSGGTARLTSTQSSPAEILKQSEQAAQPIITQTLAGGVSADRIKEMLAKVDVGAAPSDVDQESTSTLTNDTDLSRAKAIVEASNKDNINESITQTTGAEAFRIPATLMITSGRERGKKFNLDQEQMMIGADTGCQILLSGRGVPARYAIIVRRGSAYCAAALSADGLTINGESIKGSDEVELKRGDTISVGEQQLRFIEPGEVFTLKDEAVDRVLDRPKSKVNSTVKVATGVIAVLCLLVFFVYHQSNTDREATAKRKAQAELAKRKEVIAKLRLEGDAFLKEGKLIEPVGANARTRFDQILELDPDDTYAKRRVAEIADRLEEIRAKKKRYEQNAKEIERNLIDAKQYLKQKNYITPPGANAKEAYETVLRLDPDNQLAKKQLKRIDSLLRLMVGEVNELLARAKEYRAKGQIVAPREESAFGIVQQILMINPGNREASNLLLEMAAQSIYEGDVAKGKADAKAMKKGYLTAKVLGADPEYLAPRLRGLELIQKSKSDVIIYDGKDDGKEATPKSSNSSYLDSAELEKRVTALRLEGELKGVTNKGKVVEVK